MAELVGERHDVPGATLVVHQHVGMNARHGRVAKGAGVLARPRRGVDPVAGEEALENLGQRRREAPVGVEHDHLGVRPGDPAVAVLGQGRVAVPVFELLEPEPARLDPVIAMRQARPGVPDRGDQGVDHLVLDLVGEVAARDRAREVAPAVLDLLVLGERVGDQREQADPALEHAGDRFRSRLAFGPVLVREQIEDLGAGELAAVEREAQARHGLIEQPDPGAPAGDRLLVQHALDLVVELMRAEAAHVPQPGPVVGELRRLLEPLGERLVLDPVELEGDEQEPGRRLVDPLLDALEEAADLGVVGPGGVQQLRIARDPAELLLEPLVAPDQGGERVAVELAEPALVLRLERARGLERRPQIMVDLGRVGRGVEVAQVPFRQRRRGGCRARRRGLVARLDHPRAPVADPWRYKNRPWSIQVIPIICSRPLNWPAPG